MKFNDIVLPLMQNFQEVSLSEEEMTQIESFADEVIKAKKSEYHHQIDGHNEKKRFVTGLCGEMALSKVLGFDIIDWNIGNSKKFHHPDIPGYNVGVKTVEWGKFPIVFKNSHYPEIICIRGVKNPNKVLICGIATPDMIKEHQSDDLILSPSLRARGTKTGFYGFNALWDLSKLKHFKKKKAS